MRRLILQLAGLSLALLCAGCRVDATVDIDLAADGSGSVELEAVFDAAASTALGGGETIANQLIVADLAASGWSVTRPELGSEGETTIRAAKEVSGPAQLQPILDEIAGPGVFRDVEVNVTEQFARRAQSVDFAIDLERGWDLLSDPKTTVELGGEPFGVPIEDLVGARSIDDVLGVAVEVSVAVSDAQPPATLAVEPRFDAEPERVRLQATFERPLALLMRWISWAFGSLFVLSLILAATGLLLERRAIRLRGPAIPAALKSRIPGASADSSGARRSSRVDPPPADPGPSTVRLVVVEPLSVLFQQSEPPENYFLPYVRHNGGQARADVIDEAYHDLVRGRISTGTFWEISGVDVDTDFADAVFMDMRWLRSDATSFLAGLESRRIPCAAVSNDAASWSQQMRDRSRLQHIWPWLVSGELGTTLPNPAMFERLRKESGVAFEHWLYLDTRVAHLDTARELGMQTALFDPDDTRGPTARGSKSDESQGPVTGAEHPVTTDLTELLRRAIS